MSQSKVTSFYVTRKSVRIQNNKVSSLELTKNLDTLSEDTGIKPKTQEVKAVRNESKVKDKAKLAQSDLLPTEAASVKTKAQDTKLKAVKRGRRAAKSASKSCSKSSDLVSQPKVTSFYESTRKCAEEVGKVSRDPDLSACVEDDTVQSSEDKSLVPASESSVKTEKITVEKEDCGESSKSEVVSDSTIPQSPKRNLINPYEGTPPKKKHLAISEELESVEKVPSPLKCLKTTPRKLVFVSPEEHTFKSSSSLSTVDKEKPFIRTRSEETVKAIANFKDKIALIRNYESNPYKITKVISPSEQIKKSSALPAVPAYQRYSYLVDSDVSLILPCKYKLLAEMFRSMDTVVSILNNRKETITFEKVKEGVQKMMKRNFSRVHLGQIVTVMPSAFKVTLEKCTFKKASDPNYQLIISPVIKSAEGSSKKSKSSRNVIMTPQHLLDRKNEFNHQLLNLVKHHHSVFLSRLNFPSVPTESIKRWHPKFQVDLVPDIEAAALPEIPESKIYTAKDILNKVVKGPFCGKVVKALRSVAEDSVTPIRKTELESSPSSQKPPVTKSALKGVCSDLIAKVRAREAAKLLECMTESPDDVKRKAMLERLPKIVQILWHYFIAERKAAVPVDTAVEKVIHSFNSLSTHEEVKAHLVLITETFPGWLSFIQIPKGLYITVNKNKNITEMLDNFHKG